MRGGYIAAMIIAGLTLIGTFAAGCGFAVWGAVEGIGDTDKYGTVPIPGQKTLDLPEGEVSIFFETASVAGAFVSKREAVGLSIVSAATGEPVDLKGPGTIDEEVTDGDVKRVDFDSVDIPEAGDYIVSTAKKGKKVEKGSSLAFGKPLTDGVVDRARDALWGLLGFVVAGLIALATLLTGQRGRDETIRIPEDGNLPGQQ